MIAFIAGPLPFTQSGRHYQKWRLRPALRKAGCKVTATWSAREVVSAGRIGLEDEGSRRIIWRSMTRHQWTAGLNAIDRADVVVAVLDGAPDDGRLTSEVEYAISKAKWIVGLSTDLRRSEANPEWREVFAEYLITKAGGQVATSLEELTAIIARPDAPPPKRPGAASKATRAKPSKARNGAAAWAARSD